MPLPPLTFDPVAPASIPAREIITVVSGLPRSGTSLMMQILEAAGLSLFTDRERKADESNLRVYYEHHRVGSLLASPRDLGWLVEARARALKVVAPLLGALPRSLRVKAGDPTDDVPLHFRVLFMDRDMGEILRSQRDFLRRLGENVPAETADVAKAYRQQLRNARNWCDHPKVHAMEVPHEIRVTRPEEILPKFAGFLGVPEKLKVMRSRIDPDLYRARKG